MLYDKENVQPRSQRHKEYSLSIKQYEHAIETYKGDDPLPNYLLFISFLQQELEQNHDEGLKKILLRSLQSCFKQCHHEKYKNDKKFVRLWILYVDHADDDEKQEVFESMAAQKIGLKTLMYYLARACIYENFSEYENAERVFQEGIALGTQIAEKGKLEAQYEAFQDRWKLHRVEHPSPVKRLRESTLSNFARKVARLPSNHVLEAKKDEIKNFSSYSSHNANDAYRSDGKSSKNGDNSSSSRNLHCGSSTSSCDSNGGRSSSSNNCNMNDNSNSRSSSSSNGGCGRSSSGVSSGSISNSKCSSVSSINNESSQDVNAEARDYLVGYKMETISHPDTEEEISFEEFRALCRGYGRKQEVVIKTRTDSSSNIGAIIKQQTTLGSSMMHSRLSPTRQTAGEQEDLQSFLASSSSPSTSSKPKQTATPTMHTRQALDLAYGMFKDSPAFSSSSLTDEIGFSHGRSLSPGRKPACSPIAFTVYADPTTKIDTSQVALPSPVPSSFSVFQDVDTLGPGFLPPSNNTDLTPILETSREDREDDSEGGGVEGRERTASPAKEKAWLKHLVGLGAKDMTNEHFPSGVLDGSEAEFEVGDALWHVDSVKEDASQWTAFVSILEDGADNPLAMMTVAKPSGGGNSSQWEFFIAKRLKQRGVTSKTLLLSDDLTIFNGMSCVWSRQPTKCSLLAVAEAYENEGKKMPESLVIFYAIEILRAIELVHNVDILHCGIELSSLWLRDESHFDLTEDWRSDGTGGWSSQGIALGRWGWAIDARNEPNSRFRSNELPPRYDQARGKNRTWLKILDRRQVANVIFSLLCGISHRLECSMQGGRQVVSESCLRLLSRKLWITVFDQLLNNVTSLTDIRQSLSRALPEECQDLKTVLCRQNLIVLDPSL